MPRPNHKWSAAFRPRVGAAATNRTPPRSIDFSARTSGRFPAAGGDDTQNAEPDALRRRFGANTPPQSARLAPYGRCIPRPSENRESDNELGLSYHQEGQPREQ